MSHRLERTIRIIATTAAATFLLGCGELETDPPAPTGAEEKEEESNQEGFDGESQEEVRHPFSADAAKEEDDVDDDFETDDCATVCFKTAWCQDGGGDLERCVESCEESRYSGIVSRDAFDCLTEAEGCVEVARCEAAIEACAEVCGTYHHCGYFSDGVGCDQWCAGQIWDGRLDWEVQGCVTAAGRADACSDLAECGLSSPED